MTLNGLSAIITPDLGRDLAAELVAMLNHSRARIRKRAVLAIYKVLEKYPEAGSHARPRLIEKLEDTDPGASYIFHGIYSSQSYARLRRCCCNGKCAM